MFFENVNFIPVDVSCSTVMIYMVLTCTCMTVTSKLIITNGLPDDWQTKGRYMYMMIGNTETSYHITKQSYYIRSTIQELWNITSSQLAVPEVYSQITQLSACIGFNWHCMIITSIGKYKTPTIITPKLMWTAAIEYTSACMHASRTHYKTTLHMYTTLCLQCENLFDFARKKKY